MIERIKCTLTGLAFIVASLTVTAMQVDAIQWGVGVKNIRYHGIADVFHNLEHRKK